MHLYNRVLPSTGLYCLAIQRGKGFIHTFYPDREALLRNALKSDSNGHTVFIAQASFKDGTSRKQVNAAHLRAFFLDIDCGENKPYPDQPAGARALTQFCKETGMPRPAVINSGNGLYAYWPFDSDIPQDAWKVGARAFKELCDLYEFKADPARTSDPSSVLRPVGSTNRKSDQDKPVKLVADTDDGMDFSFTTLIGIIKTAAGRKGGLTKTKRELSAPKNADLNAVFAVTQYQTALAAQVAERCAQVRHIRDVAGNVDEPLWYAMLQLVRHCEDSEQVIHDWSVGHPAYDRDKTIEKVEQLIEKEIGPTTCEKFSDLCTERCIGCKHKDTVRSPIQLGVPLPKPITEPQPEAQEDAPQAPKCLVVEPPPQFMRTDEGVVFIGEDGDGAVELVHNRDFYPTRIGFDETLGYETVTFSTTLFGRRKPHEFSIRSALVHDPKAFLTALADNHVMIVGKRNKELIRTYTEGYLKRLQDSQPIAELSTQMGWKEDEDSLHFVLGNTLISEGGGASQINFANNVPQSVKAFHTKGSVDKWVQGTKIFGRPGAEAHAFAFLIGAFGAPLMKFTGYEGAMASLVGPTGSGKTLTMRYALSTYGDSKELMMVASDTQNSLVSRLGVYGNLPLAVDEVSNINGQDLSDFVYRVTQGRDKVRMTQKAVERQSRNRWNTIVLASSNHGLLGKLAGHKSDASAEINRVFEFPVGHIPRITSAELTETYRTMDTNYGGAGVKYIQALLKDPKNHQAKLDKITAALVERSGATPDERFWIATGAATLYGAAIAKREGLIAFDITPITELVVQHIRNLHVSKSGHVSDPVALLGRFLDEFSNCALRLKDYHLEGPLKSIAPNLISVPHGRMAYRVEIDSRRLYVSRDMFKMWLAKQYSDIDHVREYMVTHKVLTGSLTASLGEGTNYSGARIPLLGFNLDAPALVEHTAIETILKV